MSYSRFSKTHNVYVWKSSDGFHTLISGGMVEFKDGSRRHLLERLQKLKAAGFKIERRAFSRLRDELNTGETHG